MGASARTVTTAAIAVSLSAVAACGPSGSRYLADRDEQVYLRVPRDWREVDTSDATDPLLQQTADAAVVSKHVVSPDDGAGEVSELTGEEPVATMTVYEISGTLNQRMSTQLARVAGSGLPFDPALPTAEYEGLTEVLRYEPDPSGGERSGSRVVYRARPSTDSEWTYTSDMTTYFDPVAQRLYVLQIGCTAACFDAAAEEIDRVAGSWEVD